ncbi:hypothetical protein AB1399_05680 [Hydrogenibacillus schlegelii]|uniref:Uncharacterized protein n=1 Tax=Hydrogenibacillus schlegelii TaxID=1484 RepID=A0A132N943_HYDSH|nr:hypothetical protein [Hydrogenibacillus schlegelii]KWX06062.1 hypothetical protein TR75_07235 [Hydrogenibacillus schlegelii]OAR04316.1 hypothetical protein SA87_05080 [Hydrogenibacillus schlegelii]
MYTLPFLFLVSGLLSAAIYAVSTWTPLMALVFRDLQSPGALYFVHLFMLDGALMIAFGATYQLLSVVLGREIWSRKLGFVHYAFFALGTILLLVAFLNFRPPDIALAATLVWISVLLFAVNVGMTMGLAKKWDAVIFSVAGATFFLVMAATLGWLMGLSLAGWIKLPHLTPILLAHMWFAGVGWFGLLISGFSYKLLSMFFLAHGVPLGIRRWTSALWFLSGFFGGFSFFIAGPGRLWLVGPLLLGLASLGYALHVRQIQSARNKNNPGPGIQLAVRLNVLLPALSLLILVLSGWLLREKPGHETAVRWVALMIGAYLLGWVGLTILAYLSKIFPFLWWTARYGQRVGQGRVPTVNQLLNETWTRRLLRLVFALTFSTVPQLMDKYSIEGIPPRLLPASSAGCS